MLCCDLGLSRSITCTGGGVFCCFCLLALCLALFAEEVGVREEEGGILFISLLSVSLFKEKGLGEVWDQVVCSNLHRSISAESSAIETV